MRAKDEAAGGDRPGPVDRLLQIAGVMKALVDSRFTGYLKINFSRGAVERVEKFEEILKSK